MTGRRWLIAGLVAALVGLAGVGVMASPWWGGAPRAYGGAYGPGSPAACGYGPGMMAGYGSGNGSGCGGYGPGSGFGPGYRPGMMRGYWGYWGRGGASGGGTTGSGAKTPTASVTVTMDNLRYDPAQITVKVGTTVAFVNADTVPHNVVNATLGQTTGTPAFASPLIPPGGSWAHTFSLVGTFPILCTVPGHAAAGMVGTVTVTP